MSYLHLQFVYFLQDTLYDVCVHVSVCVCVFVCLFVCVGMCRTSERPQHFHMQEVRDPRQGDNNQHFVHKTIISSVIKNMFILKLEVCGKQSIG
jgi:hypothetical protein